MSNLTEYKKQVKDHQQIKGAAEAEKEAAVNPYIPVFIAKVPWYLDSNEPSLNHQSKSVVAKEDSGKNWYTRGQKAGPAATKYRKGACENCGAITHKTKECLERPRKVGAKWTGKNFIADEILQKVELGFDGKRDRWNGYDSQEHVKLVKEWEIVEEKRNKIREQKRLEKLEAQAKKAALKIPGEGADDGEDSTSDEDVDDEKYADSAEVVGQQVDAKSRVTVRNLRIREDTAKYLRNLNVDSAYYDPKTRSMRENPHENTDPSQVDFAGDNFMRYTGEVSDVSRLQSFAWEAEKRGDDVHLNANPTQGEMLYKQFQSKKSTFSSTQRDSIISKYGGEEHLHAPPPEMLGAQTEHYVEYSQQGHMIKGNEKIVIRSKYEEDVLINNHTAVWGSYWKVEGWSFSCCNSIIKNSYCGGVQALEAEREANRLVTVVEEEDDVLPPPPVPEKKVFIKPRAIKRTMGEGNITLDQTKLALAIEAEKRRIKSNGKRLADTEVTEETLEAYRIVKTRTNDPMANYVDREFQ